MLFYSLTEIIYFDFMINISELNDGKARYICTLCLRSAVIVHHCVFCHWKQQTSRQQGVSRSITLDKLALEFRKLSFIVIVSAIVPLRSSSLNLIAEATSKSESFNKGDQLSI